MPQYAVGVEPVPELEKQRNDKQPSTALAGVLGLFVTGLSQAYFGQWRSAVAWATVPLGAFLAGAWLAVALDRSALYSWFTPSMAICLYGGRLVALVLALRSPKPSRRYTRPSRWVAFGLLILTLQVGTTLTVRTFVLQAYKLPSGSMSPTLRTNDHVMVDMTAFHAPPRRGQLAVFPYPGDPEQEFVKRIVGLPGDRVELRDQHLWLNGEQVPFCRVGKAKLPDSDEWTEGGELEVEFLGDQAYLVFLQEGRGEDRVQGPWTVAAGEVFVLGDNRNNSSDSRAWNQGKGAGVPIPSLLGEPVVVWLAFASDGAVDWPRTGQPIGLPRLGGWMPELEAPLAQCLAQRGKP